MLWAVVLQADAGLSFDWDDVEGNSRRRLAGLAHEKQRKEEMKLKKQESAGRGGSRAQVVPALPQ